jgi:hypothetical protein
MRDYEIVIRLVEALRKHKFNTNALMDFMLVGDVAVFGWEGIHIERGMRQLCMWKPPATLLSLDELLQDCVAEIQNDLDSHPNAKYYVYAPAWMSPKEVMNPATFEIRTIYRFLYGKAIL